jgi:hypothetical protein
MAKAWRSPGHGKSKYYVTDHAIERLRERGRVLVHHKPQDMRCLISEAIVNAEPDCIWVVGSGAEQGRLIDITDSLDPLTAKGELVAVIAPDDTVPDREVVRTLLYREWVKGMIENGRTYAEAVGDREPINGCGTWRVLLAESPKVADKELPVPVPQLASQPTPAEPEPELAYCLVNLASNSHEIVSKKEALEKLTVRGAEYRLFREVKVKIKVEVEE